MTYVYILSDYEEHGATNVVATLDRTRLHAMIAENWTSDHMHQARWVKEAQTALAKLLQTPDELLAMRNGLNLHTGWGGAQLHVVRLR